MQAWLHIKKSVNIIYHVYRLKKKKHMIISTDAEIFDKIQHPLMRKTLSKLVTEGNFLNLMMISIKN